MVYDSWVEIIRTSFQNLWLSFSVFLPRLIGAFLILAAWAGYELLMAIIKAGKPLDDVQKIVVAFVGLCAVLGGAGILYFCKTWLQSGRDDAGEAVKKLFSTEEKSAL